MKKPAFRNLVESPALPGLFSAHPPQGFALRHDGHGIPLFMTDFNLLTTLDSKTGAALKKLPLSAALQRFCTLQTIFCGTTITEYAPLPADRSAEELAGQLLEKHGGDAPLLIIKDLPQSSPLLCPDDNAFADALADAARRLGFLEVSGQALAWVPAGPRDEAEYLSGLSASRRKDIRRKLRKRDSLDIETLPLGHERFFDADFLDAIYAMYLEVFRQSEIHFDLLSRDFFAALLRQKEMEGLVFFYRHRGELAGWNLCLVHGGRLIDKYIGLRYPLARELNLYFISWMVNLEYMRAKGLEAYVAGWTDPEVKAALGASFTFTRHLVRVRQPALRALLRPLRPLFEADRRSLEGDK